MVRPEHWPTLGVGLGAQKVEVTGLVPGLVLLAASPVLLAVSPTLQPVLDQLLARRGWHPAALAGITVAGLPVYVLVRTKSLATVQPSEVDWHAHLPQHRVTVTVAPLTWGG